MMSLATARSGYHPLPPRLILPAEDGTAYASACHERARRLERSYAVLCRAHGLVEHSEHADVHPTPPIASRGDLRTLADLVRSQVLWLTSPLLVESWLWTQEESALVLSRRVTVVRSPLAGLNVLERLAWLAQENED